MLNPTIIPGTGNEPLHCLVCGNDRFTHRPAQLNTRLLTFLNLDWANKTADCYICEQCGYIHWFMNQRQ